MSTATTARMNPLNGIIHKQQRMGFVVPQFAESWDIRILPNGWGVCIRDVSPDEAAEMLKTNVSNQRRMIRNSIVRFVRDMISGNWRLTHQGIAFNTAGQLHDGQNRLTAIVESGVSVPLVIFFGAGDSQEMAVIDSGKSRTAYDSSKVFGMNATSDSIGVINHLVRCAMCMSKEYTAGVRTKSDILRLHSRFENEVTLICGWFSGCRVRGVDRAPIKAAVLAAMINGASVEVLERFSKVLCEKIEGSGPTDSSARLLRIWITSNSNYAGSHFVNDLYLKTCQAILYAINKKPCGTLRSCNSNPFPVEETN